jgi:hypothetical protein
MDAQNKSWIDQLPVITYVIWLAAYVINIIIIFLFRVHAFGGDVYILPGQIPICLFYTTVVYLGPIISMIFFYTSGRHVPDQGLGKLSFVTLASISLVTNLGYTAYIILPVFQGLPQGNDIIDFYEEASTFAGYIIMILVSPFLSVVYSTSK